LTAQYICSSVSRLRAGRGRRGRCRGRGRSLDAMQPDKSGDACPDLHLRPQGLSHGLCHYLVRTSRKVRHYKVLPPEIIRVYLVAGVGSEDTDLRIVKAGIPACTVAFSTKAPLAVVTRPARVPHASYGAIHSAGSRV